MGRLDPSQERCQEPFLCSAPFFAPVSLRGRALRARGFFFVKIMIKKIACSAQGGFEFFCIFWVCAFACFWRVLPGLQNEEVYSDAKALTPSLPLSCAFSRDSSLRAHDPEDRVACEVCQSRRANMEQTFVTVKGSAMLSSLKA